MLHNSVMPHSAFRGQTPDARRQTPDEVYFGMGVAVTSELAQARVQARHARLAANRALGYSACEPESRVKPAALQLHSADS